MRFLLALALISVPLIYAAIGPMGINSLAEILNQRMLERKASENRLSTEITDALSKATLHVSILENDSFKSPEDALIGNDNIVLSFAQMKTTEDEIEKLAAEKGVRNPLVGIIPQNQQHPDDLINHVPVTTLPKAKPTEEKRLTIF